MGDALKKATVLEDKISDKKPATPTPCKKLESFVANKTIAKLTIKES